MIDLSFSLFGIIFLVMFVLVAFNMFRSFRRMSRFQNRIFEHAERKLDQRDSVSPDEPDHRPRNYECDQCGATLGDNADVSPSGDFKCTYCGKWSNIHG